MGRFGVELQQLSIAIGADDHLALALDALKRYGEFGIDQQQSGAGVLDDVAHLFGREPEVDRYKHSPRSRHSEQCGQQAC